MLLYVRQPDVRRAFRKPGPLAYRQLRFERSGATGKPAQDAGQGTPRGRVAPPGGGAQRAWVASPLTVLQGRLTGKAG